VRKVIHGYDFKGKLKKTLSSHKLNFQALKKANTILEDFEKLKAQYSQEFNKIKSEVNDGCLQLVGEVEVEQRCPLQETFFIVLSR
jgi:adenine-specific DNA-methyltransferase